MSSYYLRVEGVNIGAFVGDTEDLSTIRGASLRLLFFVRELSGKLPGLEVSEVTVGASIGLFRIETEGTDSGAEAIRRRVEELTRKVEGLIRNDKQGLAHATVTVAVGPVTTEATKKTGCETPFIEDRERLLAASRWAQMKRPSVAVPSPNEDRGVQQACELNRLRPATRPIDVRDGDRTRTALVCESVEQRRQFGRGKKQNFYFGETGREGEYVESFDEMTDLRKFTPAARDKVPRNLNRKMAVIYIDGNGFSKIQDQVAKTKDSQKDFDVKLRGKRATMLGELLDAMDTDPTWRTADGKKCIETLLWGGDEIIWAVPAWKGWETLRLFYEVTRDWEAPDSEELTHAAALIFCHKSAPIHRITNLAHYELAEAVKRHIRTAKPAGRDKDLFTYSVLESFDHIVEGLESYWEQRSVADRPESRDDWILPASALRALPGFVATLRETGFPRRKLHEIVRGLGREGTAERARLTRDETLSGLGETGARRIREAAAAVCPSELSWFHALELWDYIALDAEG